jgi:FixJ family two-component response regulator
MARIVLIDDESNLLRAHAMLLEHEGHEVAAGDSFAAVQQRLRPGDFDVLVCDVDLPALDGFAVLREVVEVRGCGEPVILLSDPPTMPSATEVLRRGAFDCAVKPVGNDRLLEVVARALRHVGLLRERDRSRQREADVLRNLTQLGEQAALLRHDIRSPMTSLRQALHAVGDQLGLEDMVLVEDLIRGIGRIEQLLAETLAFARPLELCRSQVQLGKVVADAVAQVRDLPVAAVIPIEQRGFAQVGAVSADPKLLVEVAVTLLRNAAEACRGARRSRGRGLRRRRSCRTARAVRRRLPTLPERQSRRHQPGRGTQDRRGPRRCARSAATAGARRLLPYAPATRRTSGQRHRAHA